MPSLHCQERVRFAARAHAPVCLFHPVYMISVPLVTRRLLMSSATAPLVRKSTPPMLIVYRVSQNPRTKKREKKNKKNPKLQQLFRTVKKSPATLENITRQITHSLVSGALCILNWVMEKEKHSGLCRIFYFLSAAVLLNRKKIYSTSHIEVWMPL